MKSVIIISLIMAAGFFGINFKKRNITCNAILSGILAVVLVITNYICLPVIAWGFYGLWFEALVIALVGAYLSYELEWERIPRRHIIAASVFSLVMICGAIFSSPMCNSARFSQRLGEVKEAKLENFSNDVKPIPLLKMRSVDTELARKVAEDKLGEDAGLGSRVRIGNMAIQSITGEFTINGGKKLTFKDDLIWVAPLEHSTFFKWSANKTTPGYVIVDATDATKRYLVTEINGHPLEMKFIESGYWGDDIERHLRFNGYASCGLHDRNLEIDSSGHPYWVVAKFAKKIGFSAKEVNGVVTVDPQTGDIKDYSIDDVPNWIDRIQPEDIILGQISDWGKYRGGWWNAVYAEKNIQKPTGCAFIDADGYSHNGLTLVYTEGKSYWYTGIGSSGKDKSTNGFMLVDTKTKDVKFYPVVGLNEQEAVKIAEDQSYASTAGYDACMPVLYNIGGVPTYFMILKGESGNITGYCFLAVGNRELVGTGETKAEAEFNYTSKLSSDNAPKKILTVRGIVNENRIYFILFQEVKGKEFIATSEKFPEVKWTQKGDEVEVSYREGDEITVALSYFDKLNFEI